MADEPIRWRTPEGQPVGCEEKLKVLNENLEEVRQVLRDAFEDGVLMGCDAAQLRQVFAALVAALRDPHRREP